MNMILPQWSKFIIYPFLGSFVGYITNWIAITLLFKPKKKILGIQGLLQKRKSIIANKAAELIRQYLLNTGELKKLVDKDKIKEIISALVDNILKFIPKIARNFLSK